MKSFSLLTYITYIQILGYFILAGCTLPSKDIEKREIISSNSKDTEKREIIPSETLTLKVILDSIFKVRFSNSNSEYCEQTGFFLNLDNKVFSHYFFVTAAHGFEDIESKGRCSISVDIFGIKTEIPQSSIFLKNGKDDFILFKLERRLFDKAPFIFEVCLSPERFLFNNVYTAGFFAKFPSPSLCKGMVSSISRRIALKSGETCNLVEFTGGIFISKGFSGGPIFTIQENIPTAIGLVTVGTEESSILLGCLTGEIYEQYLRNKDK